MNIREALNQVMLEKQVIVEANNSTTDTFIVSPMRNKSDNIINEVENLTINNVGNNLIEKVAYMKINDAGNDLIGCV